jgi:hypothetical protein
MAQAPRVTAQSGAPGVCAVGSLAMRSTIAAIVPTGEAVPAPLAKPSRSPLLAISLRSLVGALVTAALLAACQNNDVSREVGARCEQASECDERCLSPGNDYPGGFCTIACSSRDDCPLDTTCADREGGVCMFECTRDTDCTFLGTGWRCNAVDLRGGGIKVMVCRGGA